MPCIGGFPSVDRAGAEVGMHFLVFITVGFFLQAGWCSSRRPGKIPAEMNACKKS